jgi:hypothetical protein
MIKIAHSSGSNISSPRLCCFYAQVWAMSSFEEVHLVHMWCKRYRAKRKRSDWMAGLRLDCTSDRSDSRQMMSSSHRTDGGAQSCTLGTISGWNVSTKSVYDRNFRLVRRPAFARGSPWTPYLIKSTMSGRAPHNRLACASMMWFGPPSTMPLLVTTLAGGGFQSPIGRRSVLPTGHPAAGSCIL